MSQKANPYIAGNPVGNTNAFVGREDVVTAVSRMLRHPEQNAITLFGQRRIGKTSVLQYLLSRLPKEGIYRPIYFDLEDKAALSLGKVLGDLARVIAHELNIPNFSLSNDPVEYFKKTWLPNVLSSLPAKTSLVLLFDEFDVLADPKSNSAIAAFFPYLKELLGLNREKLKFVFVLGRNPADLNSIALSLFKGTSSFRISLLSEENTEKLIRISEAAGSLWWNKDAITKIWEVTKGHPFLTQALCSQVWERAHDVTHAPAFVSAQDVINAIPDTLESSRNTFEWLWGGLGPAERIVASALAQAGPISVDENNLVKILQESGVRIIIRELQNAPQILQDWDLLEPSENGYKFRVELLRQWIVNNRPLKRVQQEIDRVNPRAENLYNLASGYYEEGNAEEAEKLATQALQVNPSHIRANELLAEILIFQSKFEEARTLLERLYEIAPSVARPRLVQAYLAQVKRAPRKDRLALFEKVLKIDSSNSDALDGIKDIIIEQEIGKVRGYEKSGDYTKAINTIEKLAEQYPDLTLDGIPWQQVVADYSSKDELEQNYRKVVAYTTAGQKDLAIKGAVDIIKLDPYYKNITSLLHQNVTGENIELMRIALQEKNKEVSNSTKPNTDNKPQVSTPVGDSLPKVGVNGNNVDLSVDQNDKFNFRNPLRQLQVFIWACLFPSRLQEYVKKTNDAGVTDAGGMVVSILFSLPALLIFVAVGIGTFTPATFTKLNEFPIYFVIPVFFIGLLSKPISNSNNNFKLQLLFSIIAVLAAISGFVALLFSVYGRASGGLILTLVLIVWIASVSVGNMKFKRINISGKEEEIQFAGPLFAVTIVFWGFAVISGLVGFVALRLNSGAIEYFLGIFSCVLLVFFIFIIFIAEKENRKDVWLFLLLGTIVAAIISLFYFYTVDKWTASSLYTSTPNLFLQIVQWFSSSFKNISILIGLNVLALLGFVLVAFASGFLATQISEHTFAVRLSFIFLVIAIIGLIGTLFFNKQLVALIQKDQLFSTASTRLTDNMEMKHINSASFFMGPKDDSSYQVRLSSYWMDATEVTNKMYALCVLENKCSPPSNAKYFAKSEYGEYPVAFVNWTQANTYCTWAGGRLPTEAEWEYAAKGPQSLKFPWGNNWDCNLANSSDATCDEYAGASPVGSFPLGVSPFGLYDMSGNVFEWVHDWYAEFDSNTLKINPTGPDSGDGKVFRGGSMFDGQYALWTYARFTDSASTEFENFGFRCAKSEP